MAGGYPEARGPGGEGAGSSSDAADAPGCPYTRDSVMAYLKFGKEYFGAEDFVEKMGKQLDGKEKKERMKAGEEVVKAEFAEAWKNLVVEEGGSSSTENGNAGEDADEKLHKALEYYIGGQRDMELYQVFQEWQEARSGEKMQEAVLGKEAFVAQKKEEEEQAQMMQELEASLGELSMEELQKKAQELQPAVQELSKKIQAMPEDDRADFVTSLGKEGLKPMMEFRALQQVAKQKQQQEQQMQQMMQQMQGQQMQQPQAPPKLQPLDVNAEEEKKDAEAITGPATMAAARALYDKGDSIGAASVFLAVARKEEEAAKAKVKVGAFLDTSYGTGEVVEMKTNDFGTFAIVALKSGTVSVPEEQARTYHTPTEQGAEALRMVGQCAADMDDDSRAAVCYLAAVRGKGCFKALPALAVAHCNDGRMDEAMDCLREWIHCHPSYGAKNAKLGQKGFDPEADVIEEYKKAAEANPKDPEPLEILGVLYNLSADRPKAVEALQKACEIAPKNFAVLNKLGATLANAQKPDEAFEAYKKALSVRPEYIRVMANIGIALTSQQKYVESALQYIDALQVGAVARASWFRSMSSWSHLGKALESMDRPDLPLGELHQKARAATGAEEVREKLAELKKAIEDRGDPPAVEIETIKEGDGVNFPKPGDKLKMHYTGSLAATGEKFDSSRDRGEPFDVTIGVGQVIRGWDEGVVKMSLGQRGNLKIPAWMGYGARGAGGKIPPNADLIFDVEVLEIEGLQAAGYDGGEVKYDDPPEKLTSQKSYEKKLKKVTKEGGKRGVEIEGAADMGGLQFFCTTVDEPVGDVDWLYETMRAMNEKSDPTEEERKGGSGHVGKMIISIDDAKCCSLVAYVPKNKNDKISADAWLKDVLKAMRAPDSSFISGNENLAKATILVDKEADLFPLKLKDEGIRQSIDYLKKKDLFPDSNDDDDDEMVFGDDDFPSADDYA